MWLTIVSGVLTLLVGLYRMVWSDSAQLKHLQLRLAEVKARQQVEAERLKAAYARIEAEPASKGDELIRKLNTTVQKLRGR